MWGTTTSTDSDDATMRDHLRYWALGEMPDRGYLSLRYAHERRSCRIEVNEHRRTLFSYGTHFPLATVYPRGRRGGLIVLNGDRWGGPNSRTNAHQASVQRFAREICNAHEGWQWLIVPRSALDGAGIREDSIRPIDIRPDRTDRFAHSMVIPADTFGDAPHRGTVTRTHGYGASATSENVPASSRTEKRKLTGLVVESSGSGLDRAGIAERTTVRSCTVTRETVWSETCYSSRCAPDGVYGYHEHDAPIYRYTVSGATGTAGERSRWQTSASADAPDADGSIRLHWSSERHWLGDSLFSAVRVSFSQCAACRGTGIVPRADDAPLVLADVTCPSCDGHRTIERRKRYRWVSSFDYNEPQALYFLAALPHSSRATSLTMAIEDLAPAAVHGAIARGLDVKRQGDIFFVPTTLTTDAVYARATARARLTQHTRGARARAGEVGYRKPLTAAQRKRMRNERRKLWRAEMRARLAESRRPQTPRGWRAEKRKKVAAILDRIERNEHFLAAPAVLVDIRPASLAPGSMQGYARIVRLDANGRPYYHTFTADTARRNLAQCRAELAAELARPRHIVRDRGYGAALSSVWNAADAANLTDGNRARALWASVYSRVAAKYEPDAPAARIARTLAVYGTAHTATEVAVTASGTYVRGTVRHVPDVAGENRDRDHVALVLDPETWYLAIRNTVPRMR